MLFDSNYPPQPATLARKKMKMSQIPQQSQLDRADGKRILLAADRRVGKRKKNIKNPLDYVVEFLKGADDEIATFPSKPTSFAVMMSKIGGCATFLDRTGKSMDDFMDMLPVRDDCHFLFIWHVVNGVEEPNLSGSKAALWHDKDGLSFAFGEFSGQFKLVYGVGPGFAAAA